MALAVVAALARPGDWRLPGGVLGGAALIGLSWWAISSGVEGLARPGGGGGWRLVKFFTRYGILAVAAYGMMVRLHLDPVGMLVGVTAFPVAASIEAVRGLRATRRGR